VSADGKKGLPFVPGCPKIREFSGGIPQIRLVCGILRISRIRRAASNSAEKDRGRGGPEILVVHGLAVRAPVNIGEWMQPTPALATQAKSGGLLHHIQK
jgi:hypothetical protein